MKRLRRPALWLFGSLGLVLVPLVGRARDEVPGLLFRGGTIVPPPQIVVDPRLPTGHRAGWAERPASSERARSTTAAHPEPDGPACSSEWPVCVHGGTQNERRSAVAVLGDAYRRWRHVSDLPGPGSDGNRGGGPELDLYLVDGKREATELTVHLDPPLLTANRASAWCEQNPAYVSQRSLTQCVGEAAAVNLDPAMGPGMRRGWTAFYVDALCSPDAQSLRSLEDAQVQPHLPPIQRELGPTSVAGAAFWAFIDRQLGVDGRGKLPLALVHLASAAATAPLPHPEWQHAPDELDVLRHGLEQNGTRISALWSDWSVSRAFWGSRADGTHAPELRYAGAAARVAFDWTVAYSSLPRHLAGPRPLQPLGSAYIWVELDSVPLHAQLAFRAEWEAPTQFRWVVVAVNDAGVEVNRWTLPFLERATTVETTVTNFENASGLIVVGTNLGAVDVSHPFDVDQEPWEPHAYSVYLTEVRP